MENKKRGRKPRPETVKKPKATIVYLSPELHDKVETWAKEYSISSRSAVVSYMLSSFFKSKETV